MQTPQRRKSRASSNQPKGQGIYVPGPLVQTLSALIDAYRKGNSQELDTALHNLAEAIRKVEPKSTTHATPENLMTIPDQEAEGWNPVKKTQKTRKTEKDSDLDLVVLLNRHYPHIADRYARGEFKTSKDAAIAAGILPAKPG